MICKKCGKHSDAERFCPHCGHDNGTFFKETEGTSGGGD
jgi:ribosomal protein L32